MCCKRELSLWPTDKCRLLEYLWTWPVSGYQYSKRLAHTQVLITFTFLHACLHNRDHVSGCYQASNRSIVYSRLTSHDSLYEVSRIL